MRSFTIAGRTITQDSKPFVIAEIGNNAFVMDDDAQQSRSLKVAKILFDRAKANGADAIKLQKRSPRDLFTSKLYNMPYENDNSYGKTYGEHRENLEFSAANWRELVEYAKKLDIILLSTVFDIQSLEFLEQFDFPAYKVASGCLKDIPLIRRLAQTGKPLIISTGGGSWADIDRVRDELCEVEKELMMVEWDKRKAGEYIPGSRKEFYDYHFKPKVPFCFLHCVASYPNQADSMNLAVIRSMLDRYPDVIIGLSDHYQGNLMAETAYCLGARMFEKHFTGNKSWPGPDHSLSMDADDLRDLVHDFAKIQAAMGTGEKFFLPCEEKGIYKMGKGIYSAETMRPGHVITEEDIVIKSPSEGLEPYHFDELIGKVTKELIFREQPLKADMFENYST